MNTVLRLTFYGVDRQGRLNEAPVASVDIAGDGPDPAPIVQEIPAGAVWVGTQILHVPPAYVNVPLPGLDAIESER